MVKSSKKKNDDIILENLKGFASKGFSSEIAGYIPTGHFLLDFAINYGEIATKIDLSSIKGYDPSVTLGLPLGKLVEIFGEEGGGKSSLSYRICGYAQKLGYDCLWIDTEHSFAENLARLNGCNPDDIYYADMSNREDLDKVYYAEDVIDAMIRACKNGIKVIILDSVANLIPKARFEADTEKMFIGALSRMFSENLGKIVQYADHYDVLIIFINQLREKIGVQWGDPYTSPGGRSIKHNAHVRLKITRQMGKEANITRIDDDGEERIIGRKSLVQLVKNKLAKPIIGSIQIPIYYEEYFPDLEDIIFDTGRQMKIITVRKGVFKWKDISAEGCREFIDEIKKRDLVMDLVKYIKTNAEENDVLLPPEISQYNTNDLEDQFEDKKRSDAIKASNKSDVKDNIPRKT